MKSDIKESENRKIIYIDVSKFSEKELCKVLNIPYVPFYKSSFFWGLFFIFVYLFVFIPILIGIK